MSFFCSFADRSRSIAVAKMRVVRQVLSKTVARPRPIYLSARTADKEREGLSVPLLQRNSMTAVDTLRIWYLHMYRLIGLMVGARTSKSQVKIIVSENRKMPSAGFCSTKLVSEQAICDNGPSRQGRREEGQLSAGDFARSLLCNRSSVELAIAIAMPLVRSFASAKIVISFSPLCKPRKGKKYRGRGMPDFPTRRSTDRGYRLS